MKIAIISGGSLQMEFASGFFKKETPDLIIAADRGMDFCAQNGILPDYILGDFDSIDPETETRFRLKDVRPGEEKRVSVTGKEGIREVTVRRFISQKDATDTELAVELAMSLNPDEVYLIGATGTRVDHLLGNIALLYRMREKGIRGWIIDANNRIQMPAAGSVVIPRAEQFGKFISVIPYGGPVRGLTETGCFYPLSDHTVLPGEESLCVSNQIVGDEAVISWDEGVLLVIESRD